MRSTGGWDHGVDVLVVGSGYGGMTAALSAHHMGAGEVLVIEKAQVYGGTTATSGGVPWIPNNAHARAAGAEDSFQDAYDYLEKTIPKEHFRPAAIAAFLRSGPKMLDFLESRTQAKFRTLAMYPDYHTHIAGSRPGHRALEPVPISASKLGSDFEKLRPGHAFWYVAGVVSLTMTEAHDIPSRAKGWRRTLLKLFAAYCLDISWRLRSKRHRRLTVGCAGIARFRLSLRDSNIPLWLESPLLKLIEEGGRVVGAEVRHEGRTLRVQVRKGVVLAAGGFEHNQAMREKHLPRPTNSAWSASATTTNTGDAINEGMRLGAATSLMNSAWWCTTCSVPGEPVPRLSIQDKSWPGTCLVNGRGLRFANESQNYMTFQEELYKAHTDAVPLTPSYQIFDRRFRRTYLIGPLLNSKLRPDWTFPKRWYDQGFIARADSIGELAKKMGIDGAGLEGTIEKMNRYAVTGEDPDFRRGAAVYDRYYSDPRVKPNPCLAPISEPPFYAMKVDAGDIGTQGGLLTDGNAQVLRNDGTPIPGLYATGNCSAAVLPTYPGPGATLGPSMVFGYQAAKHICGVQD